MQAFFPPPFPFSPHPPTLRNAEAFLPPFFRVLPYQRPLFHVIESEVKGFGSHHDISLFLLLPFFFFLYRLASHKPSFFFIPLSQRGKGLGLLIRGKLSCLTFLLPSVVTSSPPSSSLPPLKPQKGQYQEAASFDRIRPLL